MSFQAPNTDTDPVAGFKAPDDDADVSKWSDLPGNILPDAEKMLKGGAETALRIGKGINDLPSDVIETGRQELTGGNPLDTPIAQDVKTVGEGVINSAKAIPGNLKDLGSKDAWIQHPVGNAANALPFILPFLGGEGAAIKPEGLTEALPKEAPVAPTEPGWVYDVLGDKKNVGHESAVPKENLEQANAGPIPGAGKFETIEPGEPPPAGTGGTPPPPKEDPFKDVRDYIASKGAKIEAKGGWPERMAGYLKNEATNLGAKDLGLQGRQIQSMGQGFKGLEKAEALVNYAREKGYLDPSLSDVARKQKIVDTTKVTADHLDAIRNIADKRGAPPIDAIKQAVQQELKNKYGAGVEKAPTEIKNVMADINKATPTFAGMSELATKLNKSATKVKDLGQHPGPTTDAANIVSRINNDALRGVLNPKEANLYTQSLRDYGAHKKLEQAVAGAERRNMSARSNQRGILGRLWQEALDRGGYRVGGNVANKVANTILKNPGKIKTLPQFFEELAHQSDESLDDALGISGMYEGGRVPDDVRKYVGC